MIVISGDDLRTLVPMADAVEAVRDAFEATSRELLWQAPRLASPDGRTLTMVAQDSGQIGAVVKVVSIRDDNRSRGLPTITSALLCFDGETGEPVAVINGTIATALRTGAASGVATDLLASGGAETLALIGAGAQAADQLHAVITVRAIKRISVAAGTLASATRFVRSLEEMPWMAGIELLAVASAAEAVRKADVVCCATPAKEPLFTRQGLRPTVHINAIGAYRSTMCELGPDVLSAAEVIAVDQREAALEEAGDIIQAIQTGAIGADRLVEIGEVERRSTGSGITVFKSVGIPAQDWALGTLAVTRARQANLPQISL